MNISSKTLTRVALIAAIYTVLTLILAPISFGNIQVRIAEGLCVLCLFYAPAIGGVSLGCFLSNLLGVLLGSNPTGYLDCLLGTLATLIACILMYKLRHKKVFNLELLSLLMPILWNMLIIGFELALLYMPDKLLLGTLIFGFEVGVGEAISIVLGYLLFHFVPVNRFF